MHDGDGEDPATLSPGLPASTAATLSFDGPPKTTLRRLDQRESERYRVGDEIARGGFGRILRAFDLRLERPVAIKELLAHASPSARLRFEREAIVTSRLQHPSIIPVYDTGVWPSGMAFFAMKLVEGRSLQQILADTKDLAGRLALVPVVLAVADGLAYAHRHKILHRDLKPANVLVGAFGETVIIDWGLAKDLADESAEPEGGETSPSGPALTMAGAAVGTVGYMAPEQAQGKVIDERADVYAIGALLYHVLAGTPPVVARGLGDYVSAFDRKLVPVAERAPGLASDLAAIVDKATAQDPSDRYPSAAYLAADLRRFLAGQIVAAHRYSRRELALRFVRRHRGALAVAAALLAVLAISAVISVNRIRGERARAEVERAAAEEVVGFVLGDLKKSLDSLGKLGLLGGVGAKVTGYYDALERSGDLDASAASRRADALSIVADVSEAEGQAERGLASRRAAIAQRGAGDPAASAEDLYRLGASLQAHGQLAEARAAIDEGLGRLRGHDLATARARVHGLSALAAIQYAEKGYDAALTSHASALTIAVALAAARPDDDDLARDVAAVEKRLGELYDDRGDEGRAADMYRARLAIAEKLVAKAPDDIDARAMVATSHLDLGVILAHQRPDGLQVLRQAVDEQRALAERDPANLAAERQLMTSVSLLGDALLDRHDLPGAQARHEEAHAIAARLVRVDPSHDDYLRSLTLEDNKLGDLAKSTRDWATALAHYRASAALRAFLVTKEPTNLRRRHDLATVFERMGAALEGLGQLGDALVAYRAGLAERETVLALSPRSLVAQRGLSLSCIGVGDVELRLGHAAAARTIYARALELRRGLVAAVPDSIDYQDYLSEAFGHLARADLADGDVAAAAAMSEAALAIDRRLVAMSPDDPSVRAVLLNDQILDGDVHRARGERAEAERIYLACKEVAERTLAAHPKSVGIKEALAETEEKLALIHADGMK